MLRVYLPDSYLPERKYIVGVILREFLGLEYEVLVEDREDTLIDHPEGGELRIADSLFSLPESQWLSEASLPKLPLRRVARKAIPLDLESSAPDLPILFGPEGASAIDMQTENRLLLGIDIFGSTFFMLSRYEELITPERDQHHRFPASASIAYKENFLDRPIVNDYVELLWSCFQHLWPRLQRKQKQYAFRLSHDVDYPFYQDGSPGAIAKSLLKIIINDALRSQNLSLALQRIASLRSKETDIYNTFDFIMDASERRGIKSAFYFMTGNTAGTIDGNYSLSDPWIQKLMLKIADRGHEIGLHPSYHTYQDANALTKEYQTLQEICAQLGIEAKHVGGRQHYLRWEVPITWRLWDEIGLVYDSTGGFADHTGFRMGTCYEYPVYDLLQRKNLRLIERPLIVMDTTLIRYMQLEVEVGLGEIERLKKQCEKYGGTFSLLWHNSSLTSQQDRNFYQQAIDICVS